MAKSLYLPTVAALFLLLATTTSAPAQSTSPKPQVEEPLREIYVPFEDLNVILESPTQRVFLTRAEYDALVAKARSKPQVHVPHKLALVAAEYDGQLAEGRALLTGKLTIDVLDDGLFALPLDLAGVGIRSATLDGQPAPLTRDGQNPPQVLVQGVGSHQLVLNLTAPLATAAAHQTLQVTLPTTGATRLKLAVPGNVEVKGGAAVIEREYDQAANQTRLALLPSRGPMAIVMSLNNKLLRDQRVVVARSVIVAEVTLGYERIHATVSHRVLHGAVDKLRFAVPAGFEVTRVEATQLARWEEKVEGGVKTLEATLREPTTDQVVLAISANRSPAADGDWLATLADWKFPRLVPLDVEGQVAVIGLLAEDRLRAESIQSTSLLPIDASVLASAIPASVLKAEPGAPSVRQIVTYYAPAADYNLSARFVKPARGLSVATNSLLVAADGGLSLTGGFALTPEAESLFEFHFTLPQGWQLVQVTRADGAPLETERFALATGGTRVLVRLGTGIRVGQTGTVNFEALSTPAGWLAPWETQTFDYPQFTIDGATRDRGALAAQTLDDLVVRPDKLAGLTPLIDAEKAEFGLADLPTALAYRFEARPVAATLVVSRTRPSLKAEVFSLFAIQPDNLLANYELSYEVREARTRQLAFSLPSTTPAELTVRGLEGTVVKEYRGEVAGDRRRWLVQLAERQSGLVRLAVSFQQRLPAGNQQGLPLPLVRAEEVEYQSAFVSVEGDAELDVEVATTARPVDVGELALTDYAMSGRMGRRVIGAFGYVGTAAEVKVDISRRDPYPLPAALVQRAALTTKVSAAGRSQSLATYDLLTKATLLEVRLPPESTLWTIMVADQPTKPQREGDSLLLSLAAQNALAVRSLRIVYETKPRGALGLAGEVAASAPVLLVRAAGTDAQREIPQADLDWTVHLPTGYMLRRSAGTVFTDELPPRELAAVKAAKVLYWLAGGVDPFYLASRGESFSLAKSAAIQGQSWQESSELSFSYGGNAMPSPTPLAPMAEPVPTPTAAPEMALPAAEALDADMRKRDLAPPAPKPSDMPVPLPPAPAVDPGQFAKPATPEPGVAMPQNAPPMAGDEETKAAAVDTSKVTPQSARIDTLQGISSLMIPFEPDTGGESVTFRSLGANPNLRAVVVDQRRMLAAAWGLALLVGLVGIGLTFHSARRQATYVLVVLLASCLPLLFTSQLDEVAIVLDYVFYAGCVLAIYFPLAAVVVATARWIRARLPAGCCEPAPVVSQIAGLLVAIGVFSAAGSMFAQDMPEEVRIVNLKDILPLVEPGGPVAVPPDAVIVPYDPDKPLQSNPGEKLLVPYAKYLQLWNRANPHQKIVTTRLPADHALAGATYDATLAAADSLTLVGTLVIDVYTDKPISVPLHLDGGVLLRATLDGGVARLQVVEPVEPQARPAPNPPAQQAAQQGAKPAAAGPPGRLLLLHLAGKGRKKLEFAVQMGVARQGGWRIARGQLPVGPSAALTLTVPQAGTEVRQQGLADKGLVETSAADERIETALAGDGTLQLEWRTKVSEGQVDQALTAVSTAVLDVREDSLRLVWQGRLDFGRAVRDSFTFRIPAGLLVEQVSGDNLRGWTAKTVGGEQTIDVTLLKAAQGNETLTVQIARRGRVGQGELAEFAVPIVQVEGAVLQQGELAIRRSPRLELRAVEMKGMSRADAAGTTATVERLSDATDAAVLVVQPFQTFKFARLPASLSLAATPPVAETTAEVRAIFDAGERASRLFATVIFRPRGEPLFQAQVALPAGFQLDNIGPGDLEWAITEAMGVKTLTVHMLAGHTSEFKLTLLGRIVGVGDPPSADGEPKQRELPLPVIRALGVSRQEGHLVILPDLDTDARLTDLKNCAPGLPAEVAGWLTREQQAAARTVIRLQGGDYSGGLTLVPRAAQVSVRTLTNVKITPRAIQETIDLNYQIDQAGIRRLSFLLPERLAKSRLNIKLLKSRATEPATDSQGQPLAGWVRVKIELQDYVRDEFVVQLEHDRLLAGSKQEVTLPRVENARTLQRLVVLENAGRDEVAVDSAAGIEALNSQQQAWRDLAARLGSNINEAWQAAESAVDPKLVFHTTERAKAETATARIEFAQTLLVLDAAGAYRALQEYRVTNATEQFLEVRLPDGARLWTATVAGEPVKPAEPVPPQTGLVRIPLVKTAEGEGDFAVQLKYGGTLPPVNSLGQVRFPLIRTVNINVEQSQVRLMLPEGFRWFDFGGSMRKIEDEGELAEGFQAYLSRRIAAAKELLGSGSAFTKTRAANNLQQAKIMLFDSTRSLSGENYNEKGRSLQTANSALIDEAERVVEEQLSQIEVQAGDNRERLNEYWRNKEVRRSKNVDSGLKGNFDAIEQEEKTKATPETSAFNPSFLDQNGLKSADDAIAPAKSEGRGSNYSGKPAGGRFYRSGEGKDVKGNEAEQRGQGQAKGDGQQAPQLFNDLQRDEIQKKLKDDLGDRDPNQPATAKQQQDNYQQQLQQRFQLEQRLEMNNDFAFGAKNPSLPQVQSGQPMGGGMGGVGGGGLGFAGPAGGSMPAEPGRPAYEAPPTDGSSTYFAAPGGLASLDFQLPRRGTVYDFTTPRGEIEITARPFAQSLIARLWGLAAVLLVVAIGWALTRPQVRQAGRRLSDTFAFGLLLSLVGLSSLLTGVFPVAGLVLLVTGVVLAVRSRCCPPASAAAAA
ncbi:MAG: hypothetical protein SFU86_11010 [Pirellulaceae bacterium]|nr:hypothetical protein [Pirellulaceae bacterium]